MNEIPPQEFAAMLRDALGAVNQLLHSAAEKNLRVDLELTEMPVIDCATPRTVINFKGVWQKVEPPPRPHPEPPARRGASRRG